VWQSGVNRQLSVIMVRYRDWQVMVDVVVC